MMKLHRTLRKRWLMQCQLKKCFALKDFRSDVHFFRAEINVRRGSMSNPYKNIIINMMHYFFNFDLRTLQESAQLFGFSMLKILTLKKKLKSKNK